MKSCSWFSEVEALLDGEARNIHAVEAHVAGCSACLAHREALLQWRVALAPVRPVPTLSDQQFPAFMEGIKSGIQQPRHRSGGIWALVSLAAAALVIAIATFSMFTGPTPLKADEVQSVSTDLEGASVSVESPRDGITTINISVGKDDI